MPTNVSLEIDPSDVLGVSRDASLQEIRDAYRAKARRYHPDTGGEAWAFRILVQAYETLSTARVVRASGRDSRPAAPVPEPARTQARANDRYDGSVRPGVEEPAEDPTRVVDVEKMTIWYELDHVWLLNQHDHEHRFLSSCLNLTWPDPGLDRPPSAVADAEAVLHTLGVVFEALADQTHATESRHSTEDGRFTGWLSYPSSPLASAAFSSLRGMLHEHGLVVKQWSRNLVIPRQWR